MLPRRARILPCTLHIVLVLAFTSCGGGGGTSANSPVPAPISGGGTTTQTVSISSPIANSIIDGPVRVQASVTGGSSANVKVILDGVQVWSMQGMALDYTLTAADGFHHLTVEASDSMGKTVVASVDFTAKSTPITVDPTAFSTVIERIEEQTDWLTCGNCGNSGGAVGNTATYSMERGITSPSTDGSSAHFSIGGLYPYTNAYWYNRHTAPPARMEKLRYEFDLFIPAESAGAPQAIEFECQQQIGGYIYNFGWQADFANKLWRTFDYVNTRWVNTSIPVTQLSPAAWHHIVAEYSTDATAVLFEMLTIDNATFTVNVRQDAKPVSNTNKALTNGFQLDLNKTPKPYDVYVDNMKVSYR